MLEWVKKTAVAAGIVQEVPDKSSPVQPEQVTAAPEPAHTAPVTRGGAGVPSSRVDEDMYKSILQRVDESTPEVLSQFYAMVESLSEVAPTDAGRFKAAYIALNKSNGVTATQLLGAMAKRLQALDTVIDAFSHEVASETKKVDALRKQATNVEDQVDALEKELEALRAKRRDLQSEATTIEDQVSASKATFNATLSAVKDELTAQQSNLSTHLPADGSAPARKGTTRGRVQ